MGHRESSGVKSRSHFYSKLLTLTMKRRIVDLQCRASTLLLRQLWIKNTREQRVFLCSDERQTANGTILGLMGLRRIPAKGGQARRNRACSRPSSHYGERNIEKGHLFSKKDALFFTMTFPKRRF